MASLEVKVGKLSEKKEREKRVCGGIRGTVYGKAKGKQNVSRICPKSTLGDVTGEI